MYRLVRESISGFEGLAKSPPLSESSLGDCAGQREDLLVVRR